MDGSRELLQADYCFNCIPSHLMTGITNNFPAEYVSALKYIRRGEAYKAAFPGQATLLGRGEHLRRYQLGEFAHSTDLVSTTRDP